MVLLYSNGCSLCKTVETLLVDKGFKYRKIDVACDPPARLRNHGVRAMPVLECGDWLWEGKDCINAICDGELARESGQQ